MTPNSEQRTRSQKVVLRTAIALSIMAGATAIAQFAPPPPLGPPAPFIPTAPPTPTPSTAPGAVLANQDDLVVGDQEPHPVRPL